MIQKSIYNKKHPGFKAVATHIAQSRHISVARASAILAATARRASCQARRKNPMLNKVRGGRKKKC